MRRHDKRIRQAAVLTAEEIDWMEADLVRVIPSPINDRWDPCRIVATLRALQSASARAILARMDREKGR